MLQPFANPASLPPGAKPVRIAGVHYLHTTPAGGGDLFLTEYGQMFAAQLQPENWLEESWFTARRQRLVGTSMIYRIDTKPQAGRVLDLVVRYSRFGEDVPMDTYTLNKYSTAEFNNPFQEFALLADLRRGRFGPRDLCILTKKPLAIYSPPEEMALWKTGRSEHRVQANLARHPGVSVDIRRLYLVVYWWIKGLDAHQAAEAMGMSGPRKEAFKTEMTDRAAAELRSKGFEMWDIKPAHVIVRLKKGTRELLRDRNGQVPYALVDYELLARTDEYEDWLRGRSAA